MTAWTVDVIILAGGFGTRLRPWTESLPKPLIPLLDMTLIEHSLKILPRNLIDRVIIAAGYGSSQMREYFENYEMGMEVMVVDEQEPLGTGGAISNCKEHVRGPRTLVMNGDLITTVDVEGMLRQHIRNNELASISLWPVEDPTRYGVADYSRDNQSILRFQEKPSLEEAYSNLINAGCYILEESVLTSLKRKPHSIEREVFPKIAKMGRMGGFQYSGRFIDAGTKSSYLEAMSAAIDDRSFSTGGVVGSTWYGDTSLAKDGIVRSAVAAGCNLGQGVTIENSAILEGAKIGDGATVKNCLIGENAVIMEQSHLENEIVGFNQHM